MKSLLTPSATKLRLPSRPLLLFITFMLLAAGGGLALWAGSSSSGDAPRILYLSWDDADRLQLFLTDQAGASVMQVTEAPADVVDFAVAPGGERVAFVVQFEDGHSELWQTAVNGRFRSPSLLLACPQANCRHLTWHPDGRRLLYERRDVLANGDLGSPTLYWLDAETGDTTSLLADTSAPSLAAAISPDGQWISYVSPPDEGVYAYHLENGRRFFIASETGAPASWSPDSSTLIVSDINLLTYHSDDDSDHQEHEHDYALAFNLFRADIYSEARRPLTQEASVDDGTPVWSPDGAWILFGRKLFRTDTGRQLWLVPADGGEPRPLTDDLAIHHGAPGWSPDGRSILFQRVNVLDRSQRPAIWLLDVESETMRQVVADGIQPAWIGR